MKKMMTMALLVAALMSASVSASAQGRKGQMKARKGEFRKEIHFRNCNCPCCMKMIRFDEARFDKRFADKRFADRRFVGKRDFCKARFDDRKMDKACWEKCVKNGKHGKHRK